MKNIVAELIEKTNIESICNNVNFRVNEGKKRYTFENAMKVAKRVYGKTGYAIIVYSKYVGHKQGIVEIGINGKWMY